MKTPDINLSIEDFSVANGEILFGLSAIRNVGDITAEKIVAERESGKYETVQDFLARTDSRSLNKRGVEAMIQGGAFDQFGFPRRGLYESIIDLIEDAKGLKKEKDNSQASLFDLDEQTNELTTIKNVEWEKKELLDREREMLGFFVSEDPLEGYGEIFRSESTHSIIELMDIEEDEEVNVAITGLVSNVQKRVSRRGNAWIQFDLQESTGSLGVLVFNKLVEKYNAQLDGELYLKVSGTYVGGTENNIRARDFELIEPSKLLTDLDITPLKISVQEEIMDKKNLILLKELLERHPGGSKVELEVNNQEGVKLLELKNIKVKKTTQLRNEINTLLKN